MKRKLIIATTSVIALLILVLLFFQFTNRKNNQSPTDLVSQRSKSSCSQSKAEASAGSSESSSSSSTSSSQASAKTVSNSDQALQALRTAINNPALTYSYLAYTDGIYECSVSAPNTADNLNQTGNYLVYANGQVRPENQVPADAAKFDRYKKVAPNAPTDKPDRTIRVHNAQEAVDLQRQLLQAQGIDKGDFVYEDSAVANGDYQVVVTSKSLAANGGSGTVGIYLVSPNGQSRLRN
ncbi:hypothetical protein [Oenococcus sp.]|uniref:hypothetical protein n=1 Tax=Oenococcus sp. TaxID=1979414 RepID=UPI0039ECC629